MTRRAVIEVDVCVLSQALELRLFQTGKSAREVAEALGFSPQVMTQIRQAANGVERWRDYQPSAPVLLSLAWWLGRSADDFRKITRVSLPDPAPIVRDLTGRPVP